jgi:16S rRNA (adenine1518-N6/adenine1519-N6)-dimethyltransferase
MAASFPHHELRRPQPPEGGGQVAQQLGEAFLAAHLHLLDARRQRVDMAAVAGDEAYGRLSVMLAARCRVEPLFTVGPGAFSPPPKVDSAVVRLVPHAHPPIAVRDPVRFARIVNQAFSMRRKTLRNALKGLVDAAAIEAAGLDPGARPETVRPDEYARL